jgi:hypothetical protein
MFDPYHRWLAIPRGQRPPTYYQLLGVDPDEADPDVIAEAALRQTSHVRTYQTGPYAERCTALLNEIARARATLTHPERRREYDARLGSGPSPPSGPSAAPGPSGSGARRTHQPPPLPSPPAPLGEPPPAVSLFNPFALGYIALLLLGGLLAFWLGSAPERPAAPAGPTREPGPPPALFRAPAEGESKGGSG